MRKYAKKLHDTLRKQKNNTVFITDVLLNTVFVGWFARNVLFEQKMENILYLKKRPRGA